MYTFTVDWRIISLGVSHSHATLAYLELQSDQLDYNAQRCMAMPNFLTGPLDVVMALARSIQETTIKAETFSRIDVIGAGWTMRVAVLTYPLT